MINLLKKIFACKHKHTKSGFQQTKRFDKPIVIDYTECLDCGRVLRCKVSFLEEVKPVVPPVVVSQVTISTENKDIVTGTLSIVPTVSMTMNLTENSDQNHKEIESPAPVKEEVKAPVEPPKPSEVRDAEKVEEDLERKTDDGPFSDSPEALPVIPSTSVVEASDVDEDEEGKIVDQSKDAMVEGNSFVKESKSSINQRRRNLARRREKALEQLKKTGKATIKVSKKKDGIPNLTDPDDGDNMQSECT